MTKQDVRIVTLEPLRVVAAYGFGEQPEGIAWEKLLTWMADQRIDRSQARFFGFNNPDPAPGSPNYGYEQWLAVEQDVTIDDPADGGPDLKIKNFPGGLYAVLPCESLAVIGQRWQELVHWVEESPYQHGTHQWLEYNLTPAETNPDQLRFDLYIPISQ